VEPFPLLFKCSYARYWFEKFSGYCGHRLVLDTQVGGGGGQETSILLLEYRGPKIWSQPVSQIYIIKV
jgi:hypothetical protein